jgi:DNA-directed RNA polymerase subunit RPC12/RpoP
MRMLRDGFACVECGGNMDQVEDVPVLQSLRGHVVHRCADCGHILLVQERTSEWSLGWLNSVDCAGTISCAALI